MIEIQFKCFRCGREGKSYLKDLLKLNKKRVKCFKCNKSFLVRKDLMHDYIIKMVRVL